MSKAAFELEDGSIVSMGESSELCLEELVLPDPNAPGAFEQGFTDLLGRIANGVRSLNPERVKPAKGSAAGPRG